MQQQLEAAAEAAKQQTQSHQHTLALLDHAHMEQLSKLQAQLQNQSTIDSASQTKLKLELAEQTELTQQLQQRLSGLEHDNQALQKKSAEAQAVAKMLLKQQADKAAAATASEQHSGDTAGLSDRLGTSISDDHPEEDDRSLLGASVTPITPSASTMADRTLMLEADVLRKEARVLKERLAKAEADVQKLTQDGHDSERKSAAKLRQLEGMLKQLEGQHTGSAALLDQTVAAIQSRTSILLQQRQSGERHCQQKKRNQTRPQASLA